jgi:hypothetical protein
MVRARLFSVICLLSIWVVVLFAALPADAQETLYWVSGGNHNFGLTDGDTSQTGTIYCGNTTATTTFTNPNGVATSPYPDAVNQATSGQPGGVARMEMDSTASGQTLTFSVTFGNVVDNLRFSIFDVDRSTGNWTDNLRIAAVNGSGGGTNVNLACNDGSCSYAISNNNTATATATGNADNPDHYDANGRLNVTIAGPVRTVTLTYTSGPGTVSQVISIGGFTFDCTTVPVTVASFSTQSTGTGVQFDWTTATETANVGFYLYGEIDGTWQRLSPQLIRSRTIDSLVPQSYQQHISEVTATRFALAEVDIHGQERRHGPYQLGHFYGQPVTATPVDWQAIQTEQVESTFRDREVRAASARAATTPGSPSIYEFHVDTTGLYRVTYEDLRAAGLDLQGIPVEQIALTNRANKIPIRVEAGTTAGVFGPGGFIEFLGEALDTLYTTVNVYRLEIDPTKVLRVRTVDLLPPAGGSQTSYAEKTLIEENHEYSFASPNGDPWFDTPLLAFTSPITQSFTIPVDHLVGNGPATLHVNLWGVTDWEAVSPDHHVVIVLNGVEVANRTFNGLIDVPMDLPVPAGVVIEGNNTLTITLPGDTGVDFDLVHIESYGITYPRAFIPRSGQLSFTATGGKFQIGSLPSSQVVVYSQNGHTVTRHTRVVVSPESNGNSKATFAGQRNGATYLVSTVAALNKPLIHPTRSSTPLLGERANYLIIAHANFLDGIGPLVIARQQQGFTVKVVDVADIYAQYSGGVVDPTAIQRYIRAAHQSGGVEYVLLVGGDSYDYHNYLGIGSTSFIPTLYTQTANEVRFTPADALLADLDNDRIPDLPIGRFPVRTRQELEALVAKTLAYSPHARTALFAADRKEGSLSFADISDQMIAELPTVWAVGTSTAYIDDLEVAGARAELLATLNQGVALTNYIGHSGPSAWSFENLFTDADAVTLTNISPTIALQWGCWNGYFSEPRSDTLSNRLLLNGGSGAAAAVGATTLTKVASDQAIGLRVLKHALQSGHPLGKAILLAKRDLAAEFAARKDVILGLTLLGDPALSLGPPSQGPSPQTQRRRSPPVPPSGSQSSVDE